MAGAVTQLNRDPWDPQSPRSSPRGEGRMRFAVGIPTSRAELVTLGGCTLTALQKAWL